MNIYSMFDMLKRFVTFNQKTALSIKLVMGVFDEMSAKEYKD